MKAMQKIVIKVGSSTLTQGTETLSRRYMLGLVQQMAHLQHLGLELILVSSGAVATGKGLLKTDSNPSKQTFASIGQVKLMQVWAELFSLFELQVGQVLLTKEDFRSSNRTLTQETINSLLQHKIIPIINENDTVASKELGVGNNDSLAALVSTVIGADTVILLTDQEGLYTADPRRNPHATLISVVEEITDQISLCAGGPSSSLGTGGMATKIEAAQLASKYGAKTIIASSTRPNVLIDLVEGREIGTLFLGAKK